MTAPINLETELERLRAENEKMSAILFERQKRNDLASKLQATKTMQEDLVNRVGMMFGITYEKFFGRARPEHIAWPRQVAMALMYDLCDMSLQEVGDYFSGRDHGTVLHAIRQVKNRCDVDPTYKSKVDLIRRSFVDSNISVLFGGLWPNKIQ
jgi:chromosomal replication initiator protein